jgi:hypothetical protein
VAAAPPTPDPRPAPEGSFALMSTPSGSAAVFDNNPALTCTTPCQLTLSAGRHTFSVKRDGYRTVQRIIEVPRDASARIELARMTGTLSLTTVPAGLTAFIDGQQQTARTPLSIRLPVGEHRVQVVNGADRKEIVVNIGDGEFSTHSIEWQ